jgi:hypothetical protein
MIGAYGCDQRRMILPDKAIIHYQADQPSYIRPSKWPETRLCNLNYNRLQCPPLAIGGFFVNAICTLLIQCYVNNVIKEG